MTPDPRAEGRLIHRVRRRQLREKNDPVTIEEPLEIRVEGHSVAVVMRTPGDDLDLARGFLLTEGLLERPSDIFEISQCTDEEDETESGNIVDVLLTQPARFDPHALSRHVFTSSSCGICGRATLESVFQHFQPVQSSLKVTLSMLETLPQRLRGAQPTFESTGGLHASALFDAEGNLLCIREDVGRHNALDKLIGHQWQAGNLPLSENLLLLSGRISFELMQKALCAGLPIVAGISAPSTLAIDAAEKGRQCLIGFLRGETMNLYAHPDRIIP